MHIIQACRDGKISALPHNAHHHARKIFCTDIVRPIDPTVTELEAYFATFPGLSSKYCFVMPLRWLSDVYDAVDTAIKYTTATFGTPTLLINSDNAK